MIILTGTRSGSLPDVPVSVMFVGRNAAMPVKDFDRVAPVLVVVPGHRDDGKLRRVLVEDDDVLRVLVREAGEQHGIGHGKDSGIRADAQGERQNGDGRKCRPLNQVPPPEPNVVHL